MDKKQVWFLVGLVAVAIAAYLPALQCGFIWDDDDYVTQNATLRSLDGLRRIWFEFGAVPQYYPLVHTTYWLEYQVWGLQPLGYHLVNVLLHATSAALLWLVLRRLAVPGAWLAAAIFALHPLHVESVAWVTERKNTLSGVFYLGAALVYLRSVLGRSAEPGPPSRRAYAVFLGLFVAALLSKTVTASLPAALLLVLWWRRGRWIGRDAVPLAAALALAVPFAGITIWVEKTHVGAVGADFDLSVVERCLIAGRALWFYAAKLVWPQDLTFIYPRWSIDAAAWWQYLYPVGCVAVVAGLWFGRKRLGLGPLVAVLFFGGSLAPALGFIDVYPMRYSFVADHFQYLASIGLITMFAVGCTRVARAVAFVPVLIVLATLTWQQCDAYRDLETLWRDTIHKNPGCQMAHTNLGKLLRDEGRHKESMQLYAQALRLDPNDSVVHYNLGIAFEARGEYARAMKHYQTALRLKPDDVATRVNLGKMLMDGGRFADGMRLYQEGLEIDAEHPVLHFNVAVAYDNANRTADAIRHYRKSIELRPEDPSPHNNLGNALMKTGKGKEAVESYRSAVLLRPRDPAMRLNLANALMVVRAVDEAIEAYLAVLGIESAPDQTQALAHYNVGLLFSSKEDRRRAVHHFREAVGIDPSFEEAKAQLRLLGER